MSSPCLGIEAAPTVTVGAEGGTPAARRRTRFLRTLRLVREGPFRAPPSLGPPPAP